MCECISCSIFSFALIGIILYGVMALISHRLAGANKIACFPNNTFISLFVFLFILLYFPQCSHYGIHMD